MTLRSIVLAAAILIASAWSRAAAAQEPTAASPTAIDTTAAEPTAEERRERLHANPALAGLLRPDRLQHASLAFAIGAGAGLLTKEPAAAAGVSAGLGLLKEMLDRSHGGFDAVDLAADLLGAGLATLATLALKD